MVKNGILLNIFSIPLNSETTILNITKLSQKNGNKPWSLDPEKSKYAGKTGRVSKKTRKVYDKKIDGEKIPKDVKIRR